MPSKYSSNGAVAPWHSGRMANSGLVLNLAILRHILLFIEGHKDLLAAMSTCHALYIAGIQPLVRLPVTIYEDAIGPFHDFMLSHSPATFLAFRELHIDCGEISFEDTYDILALLERGTKLRQLTLPYTVIDENKGIGEAIASLKELEELAIKGGYYYAIDRVLTQLHSPLAKIEISFEYDWIDGDEDDIKDPARLLANFQTTLKQATITCAPFFTVDFCYPKLLDLEIHLSGGPSLFELVVAFPNLQTLTIRTDTGMEDEELADLRHQNVVFQNDWKCWEYLTSVNADLVALYAMGLKHPLKSVTIAPMGILSSDRLSFLRTVISTTKSEALSLHLLDTPSILSKVFSDVGNSFVSLELTLEISWLVGPNKTLDVLFKELPSLTAVMFHLTLLSRPFMVPEPAIWYVAESMFHDLNERALAYRIGASMRNVEWIYLDIGGRRVSYWMNTGSGTENKEWTRARLDKPATGGGLSRFLSRIISPTSVSS